MNQIRLAVIGAGLIGAKHAELVCSHDKCTLVGICDNDRSRKVVAERCQVPFYTSVEELIAQEKPSGAIIATPNSHHASAAEACTKRSVHVLIEKPIADTLEQAQHIVEMSKTYGTRVLVGHHRRYNSLILKTRELVREGAMGKLIGASVLWALMKPDNYYEVGWRKERLIGGPALINLIHDLDSLRFICGEITEIYAQTRSEARSFAVEDSLNISLCFENGALGTLLATDASPSPWSYEATTGENPFYFNTEEGCYHFLGTSGALAFPTMDFWRYPDKNKKGWQYPMKRTRIKVDSSDPLLLQLEHFCRVVEGKEEPKIDGEDAAKSLSVVLAVHESALKGQPVNPLTLFPNRGR